MNLTILGYFSIICELKHPSKYFLSFTKVTNKNVITKELWVPNVAHRMVGD